MSLVYLPCLLLSRSVAAAKYSPGKEKTSHAAVKPHRVRLQTSYFSVPGSAESANVAITAAITGTIATVYVFLIWAEDMLGDVAPAILASFFILGNGRFHLPGHTHCLVPQVNTGRIADYLGRVIVFLESHN